MVGLKVHSNLKKIAVPCTPEPKFDQGFLGWVSLPQFLQMSLLLLLTDKIMGISC